jgi:MFS family permease
MSFRSLLATPGIAGPFAASMVARLPVTALVLLLVLHVEHLTGRFALAGLAGGAYALGLGLSAPALGRLIDRHGQVRVLAPCGALVSSAITAIALLPGSAPVAVIVGLALLTGMTMPPLGSTLRALWMELIEPERRHAAFALDSAAVELLYILGPVAVAGGIGAWSTRVALGFGAACIATGVALYVTRPAIRAWQPHHHAGGLLGPLAAPAVRVLLGVLLLLGVGFGSVEVGVASVATAAGHQGWAGWLLGAWGLGSMGGALWVAKRPAPADPAAALVVRLLTFAVAHALLLLSTAPGALAGLLLVAGVTVAPALNGAFVLIGEAAPPGTVTETFTWATFGITAGIAAGSALGGALADSHPHAPFMLIVGVGVAALVVGRLRRPVLVAVAHP